MNGNPQASRQVDSYRFLDRLTQKLVQSWIELEIQRERPAEIPWAPLSRPLADSTVALISSAGLALKKDRPFDQEGERRNPWWGDPSYRKYLLRHPWHIPNLFAREVPDPQQAGKMPRPREAA